MHNKHYAGIGSRKTPENILLAMTEIAVVLESDGYVLRSGGADGADSAFEEGVLSPAGQEIYLPWKGFNHNQSPLYNCYQGIHTELAEKHHLAWDNLSQGVKKLMIRNSAQIIGIAEKPIPVDFVICWTLAGPEGGGTGQAIRIAKSFDVPIYNMKYMTKKEILEKINE